MLLDGYWKKDLRRICRSLSFWSKNRSSFLRKFAEHRVNRGLLYSAVIIRKIMEDEKDAEKIIEKTKLPMPSLPVKDIEVPVIQYNHIDDEKIFLVSSVILEDYDLKHYVKKEVELWWICNQIIHSYAWAVVHKDFKSIGGVLLASDKFREEGICYLTVCDWIAAVRSVIEKAHIK